MSSWSLWKEAASSLAARWTQQSKHRQRSILFIAGVAGFCAIRYAFWKMYNRLRSYPKGPLGLPGLGCFLSFGADTFAFLAHTGSAYGGLAYFPLMLSNNVLISDASILRQLYRAEKLVDRPPIFRRPLTPHSEHFISSITGSNGEHWSLRRKLAMKTILSLTKSTFVLSKVEQAIAEHVAPTLDRSASASCSWLPREAVAYVALNSVWTVVFGDALARSDGFLAEYAQCVRDFFARSSLSMLLDLMTNFSRRRVFRVLKWQLAHKYGNAVGELLADWMNRHGFIVDAQNNVLARSDSHAREHQDASLYVDVLIEAVRAGQLTVGEALADIADAILGAGTDTTSASAEYMLLLLAKHPEVQQQVYDELQRVMQQHHLKTFDFRILSELHVFRAFVWESLRISCVAPAGLPHVAHRDVEVEVDGEWLVIPAGTLLHANVHYMHKYVDWSEGNQELERENNDIHLEYWLRADGGDETRRFQKNDNFVLFGVGQRDCMGQTLAIKALYAMLGVMINKYKFVAWNNDPTGMDIKQSMAIVATVDPPIAITVEKR